MKHEEGFVQETLGGGRCTVELYRQAWLPEGKPRAALLLVHGLAEHSGRYGNVVGHFVPRGYAAYGLDHVGHGRSEGTRVCVDCFEDYTEPIASYFDQIRKEQPGLPVFLVGHSLGGLIGAYYLLDHQAGLAGAVLSGPAVKVPDNISPTTLALSRMLSKLAPKMGVTALAAEGVSKDPAVVQAYVNDPLVYRGKTTARLAAEMLRAMQRVQAEAGRIELPLLVLHGGDDRLVPPEAGRLLYGAAGSRDKTLKVYDGLYHEVFNEPEREMVLADVEAWLEAHLAA